MKGERPFVWLGGALFVSSLVVCVSFYIFAWGAPSSAHPRASSIVADALLVGVFATHHSLFARDSLKTRIGRWVPARLLRSVYVWIASLLLMLVCLLWQPVGGDLYRASGWLAVAHAGVQLAGVWIIARSVRMIDPLELAGIRDPAARDTLQITGPYRWVRHPLYLGWMLAGFGAAHMTGDRLAFAAITSGYLVVAMPWEERALVRSFGDDYRRYAARVRWRIVPYLY